jgi:hypothetical protein
VPPRPSAAIQGPLSPKVPRPCPPRGHPRTPFPQRSPDLGRHVAIHAPPFPKGPAALAATWPPLRLAATRGWEADAGGVPAEPEIRRSQPGTCAGTPSTGSQASRVTRTGDANETTSFLPIPALSYSCSFLFLLLLFLLSSIPAFLILRLRLRLPPSAPPSASAFGSAVRLRLRRPPSASASAACSGSQGPTPPPPPSPASAPIPPARAPPSRACPARRPRAGRCRRACRTRPCRGRR